MKLMELSYLFVKAILKLSEKAHNKSRRLSKCFSDAKGYQLYWLSNVKRRIAEGLSIPAANNIKISNKRIDITGTDSRFR
jgi:hypothetical protein